jgi:hypothetical protein
MKKKENDLSIESWYGDIDSLESIPENERTLKRCFLAIHDWGAALEWVPEKYKTYELCLDAVRHNSPESNGCSALAFVPDELKTHELCLEAIRHDYTEHDVEFDYAAATNFVPQKLRTPELCFEAFINQPYSQPGYFNFIEDEEKYKIEYDGPMFLTTVTVTPMPIQEILDSSELFIKALKQIGMPDEYNEDALKYFEKRKVEK